MGVHRQSPGEQRSQAPASQAQMEGERGRRRGRGKVLRTGPTLLLRAQPWCILAGWDGQLRSSRAERSPETQLCPAHVTLSQERRSVDAFTYPLSFQPTTAP